MSLIIAGIGVFVMAYCMIKRYETRLVLLCTGIIMALCAGEPMAPFKAFSHALQESRVFEAIVSVMGFAFVMKATECDQHLIQALVKPLRNVGPLLIPCATLVTFFCNISIASSAGSAAAVGSILIPILLAAGVHPATAAACVWAGTFGNMLNPGFGQVAVIAQVTQSSNMEIVANHFYPTIVAVVLGAIAILAVAHWLKEDKGYVLPEDLRLADHFKVHPVKALVPLLPLTLLMLGNFGLVPVLKQLAISHAMIIGCFCAFLVTRVNPQKISKEFWLGAGDAFGHIVGIIICALVFVSGLRALGAIDAMTSFMAQMPDFARASSAIGPFILAVLSGSGDAAGVAFNRAVTPEAVKFGLSALDMGSMAALAGALGRTMSPLAGGMIICSVLAGCSPMDAARRNAPGMIIACAVAMILLYYKPF